MYIVPLKRNIFTWIVRRSLRADVSKYRPESIGINVTYRRRSTALINV